MTKDGLALRLLTERFSVCRLAADESVPEELPRSSLLSITRTADELSVVCEESDELPGIVESGWRCLVVDGPLAFDQVGILASLAQPLADAGVSVFVISTYDTDYLLVKEAQLETALGNLKSVGHSVL